MFLAKKCWSTELQYISTRGAAPILDFEETLLTGLAEDGGLYVPKYWPQFEHLDFQKFSNLSYEDLAIEIIWPFVGSSISKTELRNLVYDSYSVFSHEAVTPLKKLSQNEYLLELFHGPTLAFKDCAMQFLARMLNKVLSKRNQRSTNICATSGDTGAAAVEAFKDKEAINLFVFYPEGRVSSVQQKQMTSVTSKNIFCIAIKGTFDDCQAIVKNIFNDRVFSSENNISAVNSINWVRVMVQIVYYFYSALKLGSPEKLVSFSVPTGNFGDIYAGYAARKMGLPIQKLCIATNRNDILARFIYSGSYQVGNVIPTYSPSMDIQVASNFERLLFDFYEKDTEKINLLMNNLKLFGSFDIDRGILDKIRKIFVSKSVSEEDTLGSMSDEWKRNKILIDPHTAVGVSAGRSKLSQESSLLIFLATADPSKFPDAVFKATGEKPKLPSRVSELISGKESFDIFSPDVEKIKDYISKKNKLII